MDLIVDKREHTSLFVSVVLTQCMYFHLSKNVDENLSKHVAWRKLVARGRHAAREGIPESFSPPDKMRQNLIRIRGKPTLKISTNQPPRRWFVHNNWMMLYLCHLRGGSNIQLPGFEWNHSGSHAAQNVDLCPLPSLCCANGILLLFLVVYVFIYMYMHRWIGQIGIIALWCVKSRARPSCTQKWSSIRRYTTGPEAYILSL